MKTYQWFRARAFNYEQKEGFVVNIFDGDKCVPVGEWHPQKVSNKVARAAVECVYAKYSRLAKRPLSGKAVVDMLIERDLLFTFK